MITKEMLRKKYNISEELIQSTAMTWDELDEIYNDFSDNKYTKYKGIMDDFLNTYLKDVDENVKIHSIRSRVKDAEHLVVKIIRKKQENYKKYEKLDKSNYEKFVTDLVGIRCIVLFKEDWENLHYYLLSKFENNVDFYIRDAILDFDDDVEHFYIAEKPKVHIRNGDARDIYERVLSPDCVKDNKVYRSIHYIIKYKGVYIEIQVRTLFEEGWGEVDHAVVYPYYQDDKILKEYTELLNRLAGLADEMSSFFNRLKQMEIQRIEEETPNSLKASEKEVTVAREVNVEYSVERPKSTPSDCLQAVFDE